MITMTRIEFPLKSYIILTFLSHTGSYLGGFMDFVPRPPFLRKGKIYHVLGKLKYLCDVLLYITTLFSCPQITGCVHPGFEIAAFLSNCIQNDFVGLTWNDEWDPLRVVINFFPLPCYERIDFCSIQSVQEWIMAERSGDPSEGLKT